MIAFLHTAIPSTLLTAYTGHDWLYAGLVVLIGAGPIVLVWLLVWFVWWRDR